jgi:hypothetical protein
MSKCKLVRNVLLAAFAVVATSATVGAAAHDGQRRWADSRYPEYRQHRHSRHHPHRVVGQPVFVRSAPPVVYEQPVYYPRPVRYYGNPSIVIGFDLPPLVIPLR